VNRLCLNWVSVNCLVGKPAVGELGVGELSVGEQSVTHKDIIIQHIRHFNQILHPF
jgi:hypothetical protein